MGLSLQYVAAYKWEAVVVQCFNAMHCKAKHPAGLLLCTELFVHRVPTGLSWCLTTKGAHAVLVQVCCVLFELCVKEAEGKTATWSEYICFSVYFSRPHIVQYTLSHTHAYGYAETPEDMFISHLGRGIAGMW